MAVPKSKVEALLSRLRESKSGGDLEGCAEALAMHLLKESDLETLARLVRRSGQIRQELIPAFGRLDRKKQNIRPVLPVLVDLLPVESELLEPMLEAWVRRSQRSRLNFLAGLLLEHPAQSSLAMVATGRRFKPKNQVVALPALAEALFGSAERLRERAAFAIEGIAREGLPLGESSEEIRRAATEGRSHSVRKAASFALCAAALGDDRWEVVDRWLGCGEPWAVTGALDALGFALEQSHDIDQITDRLAITLLEGPPVLSAAVAVVAEIRKRKLSVVLGDAALAALVADLRPVVSRFLVDVAASGPKEARRLAKRLPNDADELSRVCREVIDGEFVPICSICSRIPRRLATLSPTISIAARELKPGIHGRSPNRLTQCPECSARYLYESVSGWDEGEPFTTRRLDRLSPTEVRRRGLQIDYDAEVARHQRNLSHLEAWLRRDAAWSMALFHLEHGDVAAIKTLAKTRDATVRDEVFEALGQIDRLAPDLGERERKALGTLKNKRVVSKTPKPATPKSAPPRAPRATPHAGRQAPTALEGGDGTVRMKLWLSFSTANAFVLDPVLSDMADAVLGRPAHLGELGTRVSQKQPGRRTVSGSGVKVTETVKVTHEPGRDGGTAYTMSWTLKASPPTGTVTLKFSGGGWVREIRGLFVETAGLTERMFVRLRAALVARLGAKADETAFPQFSAYNAKKAMRAGLDDFARRCLNETWHLPGAEDKPYWSEIVALRPKLFGNAESEVEARLRADPGQPDDWAIVMGGGGIGPWSPADAALHTVLLAPWSPAGIDALARLDPERGQLLRTMAAHWLGHPDWFPRTPEDKTAIKAPHWQSALELASRARVWGELHTPKWRVRRLGALSLKIPFLDPDRRAYRSGADRTWAGRLEGAVESDELYSYLPPRRPGDWYAQTTSGWGAHSDTVDPIVNADLTTNHGSRVTEWSWLWTRGMRAVVVARRSRIPPQSYDRSTVDPANADTFCQPAYDSVHVAVLGEDASDVLAALGPKANMRFELLA
jgi:hypothetical protein